MEEDKKESEDSGGGGTRSTPIEVREEVVEPLVVLKPVEVRPKARVEVPPIGALPKKVDIPTTAMGQWTGGPHRDKRKVVVEESSVGGRRQVRHETVVTTTLARSIDAGSEERLRSANKQERGTPVFEDMEEPTVEIVVWTTAHEEALKKVTGDTMVDEGELSPKVLYSNRQKYKEMMFSLAVRDATEEEYRKAKCMKQPYRGIARPFWQKLWLNVC